MSFCCQCRSRQIYRLHLVQQVLKAHVTRPQRRRNLRTLEAQFITKKHPCILCIPYTLFIRYTRYTLSGALYPSQDLRSYEVNLF